MRYDLVVIGGGTGGLVASVIAAGAGARVALVERDRTGGDCLWTGCVPSKSLIAAATLAQRMRRADAVGLRPVEPEVDFTAVMERVRAAQRAIEPQDSPERLRREGVEVIEGSARFVRPGRVAVGERELAYRAAIVATGSEPVVPPLPGLVEAEPLTTDTVWDLDRLPARLAILGGGPVGCELAQAFARLGSRVALVEQLPRLLDREEDAASRLVADRLQAEGVDVRTGTRAQAVRGSDELVVRGAGGEDAIPFDRLLVAVGRRPRTADLGLPAVGVRTTAAGAVAVDARLRTSARRVFAVGDVTGVLPFTHVAAYQARIAAQNALFPLRRTARYDAVPWVTFTDPEVARVGLTEAQARARWGPRARMAHFDYAELDRAIVAGEPYGFAKLVGDPRGRLVGATVAAPAAGEAIAELAAWLASGAKIDAVSQTVHAYPTLAEGPARAADDFLRARYLHPRTRRFLRPLLASLRALDRVA
jgi:pyruvate/2-oxoglutarate dehydrogenase complex dihydrolipoamide dehydrogenase (E3) component